MTENEVASLTLVKNTDDSWFLSIVAVPPTPSLHADGIPGLPTAIEYICGLLSGAPVVDKRSEQEKADDYDASMGLRGNEAEKAAAEKAATKVTRRTAAQRLSRSATVHSPTTAKPKSPSRRRT